MKHLSQFLRTFGYVPAQARDEAIAAEQVANERLTIATETKAEVLQRNEALARDLQASRASLLSMSEAKQKTDDLNRNLRATVDEVQSQLFRAQQQLIEFQAKTIDWFARAQSGRPILSLQPEQAGPPSLVENPVKPSGRRQARDVINEVSEADRQWWEEQKKATGMTEARQTEGE